MYIDYIDCEEIATGWIRQSKSEFQVCRTHPGGTPASPDGTPAVR